MTKKFIFITGGVISSLGKGLITASIGMLLESRGLQIAMLKFDPYLNIDPGTMNPYEHGEIYVTEDGAETDLDLGHYHRFTNSPLSKISSITSGQIYTAVIQKERKGSYKGATVQVIPHVTDEIKTRIHVCALQDPSIDVVLVEVGGTVGDIESEPFLEAIRQFCLDHPGHCLNIHLTYVPYLRAAGEIKTKPTQHAIQKLRSIGILPDLILCRTENTLTQEAKNKISLFCSVAQDRVIAQPDLKYTIYELPLYLKKQQLDEKLCSLLNLSSKKNDISEWEDMVSSFLQAKHRIRVALVGKYVAHQDAYKSICEALTAAAIACHAKIEICPLSSDQTLHNHEEKQYDGYLIPGGFGARGFEEKIQIASHCRTNKIPYLGICLGMQVLVVEFARFVMHLKEANSTEIDPTTPHPIITLMQEQKNIKQRGGTMRLGTYPCSIKPQTQASQIYLKETIFERHRHRYEFNNTYLKSAEDKGLIISGMYSERNLAEIVEIKDHPWMVGVQFHPEFQSKPTAAHPLFVSFLQAMLIYRQSQ